jgi:HK97 family phage major capsid protein
MTVEITSEPLTYDPAASTSYFRDRALDARGDERARERLERHGREMGVEIPRRDAAARMMAAQQGLEFRVNPNTTDGQGGFLSPPLWLIDKYAGVPRASRVLADLVPTFPLPRGVSSVNLPRLTTGGSVAPVSPLGTPSDTDLVDAAVSSPVVTIAGLGLVSMQVLEQSPPGAHLDWAIFKDLSQAYDEQLETQMLNGTGAGGQLLGVVNVPGIASVPYTSGTPAGPAMYTAWCQLVAQVGDARKAPPEAFLTRTARWAWLASQPDSSGRPLIPPGTPVPGYAQSATRPHGSVASVPAYSDDAIAVNLGAGTNQDEAIACKPSDMILLEGTPRVKVNVDTGVSGTLQARLEFLNYAAFLPGRYPAGIGVCTGTGAIIPTGW